LYLGIRTTINGDSAIKFRKSKALCEAQQAGRRYLFRHPALKADTDGGTFEHVNLLNYASHKKELPTRPNQELDRRFLFGSRFNCDSATGFEGNGPARYYRSTRAITDLAPEKFEVPRKSDREVLKLLDYASQFPRSLEARALFELIGLYVAKGATQAPARKREKLTRITIRPRGRILNRDRIASTIRNLGLKPRVTRNGVSFSSQIVAEFLRKECGSKSEEKRLPGFVFSAPFELRRMLFEVLMQSGGDIRRGVYSTISEKLAEDFHHLAFTLGIEALIRTESLNNGNRIFRVKLFGRGHRVIYGSNFTITPVTGLHVYCVTAQDNHIIYAGRDGKFGWIGQSYGVFGAETFALYCPPVAEATAAIGRYAITETIKKAQSLGVKVFYGDTDSIFLGSENPELLHQLIEWSKSNLSMELEIDKNYRYLALSSRKKNYLGVYPDGSVDIKGLTGKKRHIPQFLHAAFYEMIEILRGVQSPEEFEKARASIAEIVRSCYLKLRNREYPLEQLAFSVMISRPPDRYTKTTPQHVKAASLLVKRGVEVKAGDLISFVKVLSEPGVKPVQLASYEEIDIEKYLEYLRSTFEQVLDALGLEFEELIGLKKLESFFDTQSC
jgi:DNA polymerase I